MRILLIRGALLETIPEAEQVRFLRAGFVTRAGAVRASSPPALRPGRGVLRLSAFGGAGNACALPFARSAAWAESKRSVALASAAVGAPEGERLPTSGRFRAQTGCADCVNLSARRGHGWMRLSALRLPALFPRDGSIFDGVVVARKNSDADAPRGYFVIASASEAIQNCGPPARTKLLYAEIVPA
jgi:hypothetical protein